MNRWGWGKLEREKREGWMIYVVKEHRFLDLVALKCCLSDKNALGVVLINVGCYYTNVYLSDIS